MPSSALPLAHYAPGRLPLPLRLMSPSYARTLVSCGQLPHRILTMSPARLAKGAPLIPARRRQRQMDLCEMEASL